MANPDHLAILKQGVVAWNAWREANPDVRPDLVGAKLGSLRFAVDAPPPLRYAPPPYRSLPR